MSKPVEEFEICALIDGELDATRAAEVRSAIERDPVLHAQFARLAEADRTWVGEARSAQFMPAVPWDELAPSPGRAYIWIVTALAFVLAAGRLLPRVLPVELTTGMVIHALLLTAVIAVVVWISGHAAPEENAPTAFASWDL
jgi:anti-sigma factor RsiW